MSPECLELSTEQLFRLRTILQRRGYANELNTTDLSADKLRELFVEISRQLIVKDNIIRHLMKNSF
jgi:hypothetical protein